MCTRGEPQPILLAGHQVLALHVQLCLPDTLSQHQQCGRRCIEVPVQQHVLADSSPSACSIVLNIRSQLCWQTAPKLHQLMHICHIHPDLMLVMLAKLLVRGYQFIHAVGRHACSICIGHGTCGSCGCATMSGSFCSFVVQSQSFEGSLGRRQT
jgi:hypothetical protein